ncbi:MAG: hypothetical protein ABFS86_15580 [Planctomycetota bacterium]
MSSKRRRLPCLYYVRLIGGAGVCAIFFVVFADHVGIHVRSSWQLPLVACGTFLFVVSRVTVAVRRSWLAAKTGIRSRFKRDWLLPGLGVVLLIMSGKGKPGEVHPEILVAGALFLTAWLAQLLLRAASYRYWDARRPGEPGDGSRPPWAH